MMNKIVVNKASVKVRRRRFRKCKCVPLRHVCDGCLSVNRKCPFRMKYRDERAKNKRMSEEKYYGRS